MLIDYLPPILQNINTVKIIMYSEDEDINELFFNASNLKNDQYFFDATEKAIKRYEKMLSITSKATETLDERRFRLFLRYNKQMPYTVTVLERQLTAICGANGYEMNLDYKNLVLTVKINLMAKNMFKEVENYLDNVVPLNVIIDLDLLYNQYYKLSKITHNQLSNFTQYQIRNEVLTNANEYDKLQSNKARTN